MSGKRRKAGSKRGGQHHPRPHREDANPLPHAVAQIEQALEAQDLTRLRRLAADTGFLTAALRRRAWPLLARADDDAISDAQYAAWSHCQHRDSEVVRVDVARSLWSFTPDWSGAAREHARQQLTRILTAAVNAHVTVASPEEPASEPPEQQQQQKQQQQKRQTPWLPPADAPPRVAKQQQEQTPVQEPSDSASSSPAHPGSRKQQHRGHAAAAAAAEFLSHAADDPLQTDDSGPDRGSTSRGGSSRGASPAAAAAPTPGRAAGPAARSSDLQDAAAGQQQQQQQGAGRQGGTGRDPPAAADGTRLRQQQQQQQQQQQEVFYYQGLHDVASVLLLTLGERSAASVLSQLLVGHLRDASRRSLDPVMEALGLMGSILDAADPRLARFTKDMGLMPWYALSWFISWFAHDITDLQQVTRLFDAFIAHHPLLPLYVGAVAMRSQRARLFAAEDMPQLHSMLVNLDVTQALTADQLVQQAMQLFKAAPPSYLIVSGVLLLQQCITPRVLLRQGCWHYPPPRTSRPGQWTAARLAAFIEALMQLPPIGKPQARRSLALASLTGVVSLTLVALVYSMQLMGSGGGSGGQQGAA